MNTQFRNVALIFFAAALFPLPYVFRNWWRYIPETLLLLVTLRAVFGTEWRERMGLSRDGVASAVVFLLVTTLSLLLVPRLTDAYGFRPIDGSRYFLRPLFSLFHAFNEELVFRALPLLAFPWARLHRWKASIAAALVFSLAHAAFYPMALGGPVGPLTLASLFLLGLGLNAWCVARGSIAIPWAIHAGANIALFGMADYTDALGHTVSPARFFDSMLSHPAMFATTALLAISGAAAIYSSRRRGNTIAAKPEKAAPVITK